MRGCIEQLLEQPVNAGCSCYTRRVWNTDPQSVSDYLRSVREIRVHWGVPEHKELWFRGEDGEYGATRLRPKLYRPSPGEALRSIADLLDIENDLYEDFQRCGAQLCHTKPDEDWDWYFLMQHHGVPARILDWSDGALVGLHFAVRQSPCGPAPARAVVFVLDPYRLLDHLESLPDYENAKARWKVYCQANPWEDLSLDEWDRAYLPGDEEDQKVVALPQVPLLSDTAQMTRRIAAQRSRFMIFGTEPSWMSDLAGRPDSPVKILTIEAAVIATIRHELRDAGVTESVIFPDLDGLGRELNQSWEQRR